MWIVCECRGCVCVGYVSGGVMCVWVMCECEGCVCGLCVSARVVCVGCVRMGVCVWGDCVCECGVYMCVGGL